MGSMCIVCMTLITAEGLCAKSRDSSASISARGTLSLRKYAAATYIAASRDRNRDLAMQERTDLISAQSDHRKYMGNTIASTNQVAI